MSAQLIGFSYDPFILFALPTSCSYQPQTLNSEIDALNARIAEKDRVAENKINLLNERIGELERDNTRLKQTLTTIKTALRKANLTVDLDDNLVRIAEPPMHAATRITGTEDTK